MVFDAPYCEVELHWAPRPSIRRIASNGLRWLFSGLRYPAELEARLAEAQRNHLEAEKARSEAELLSRELEERVRERTAELEEALERIRHDDLVKTNLLASLSHELRTPMTLVSLPLGRLISGERGPLIRSDDEYLLAAKRHAEGLVDTLDGILDFTAVAVARGSMSLETVRLDALVREVVDALRYEAERRGVALGMGPASAALVRGESRLLRTAVVNLASNALKYTRAGGSVTLGLSVRTGPGGATTSDDGFADVSVVDTGVGIASEEIGRVFERGYRSPSAMAEPGWGLGLALVKEIAEAHRGSISCLSLPLAEPSKPRLTEPLEPPDSTRPRVLYVEDNGDLAGYVAERLSRRCDVDTVGSAELAEARLAVAWYDVVVSDVMLPGIDGLELYRRAKAWLARTPPFLFVTARADEAMREAALDEGAVDYIRKPFDEAELETKVRNLAAYSRVARPSGESLRAEIRSAARAALAARGVSPREIEVALLLGDGLARKEIAAELGIATATVKRHVENLFSRLGVQDRFQLYAGFLGPAALGHHEGAVRGDSGPGQDRGRALLRPKA